MRSRFRLALAVATISTLSGCADVPVLGNVGQALSGVTAPIMGLLDPVIGRFLPKHDDAPAATATAPRRRTRRLPGAAPAAGTAPATESAEAIAARAAAAATAWSERNRQFDHVRSEGLLALYQGRTADAIKSFKQAQTLKPDNAQIASLIKLCETAGNKAPVNLPPPQALPQAGGGSANPPGPPGLPANLPPGANQAVQQLLKNANPQGDKPGDLF
jgi:hypothetical protein